MDNRKKTFQEKTPRERKSPDKNTQRKNARDSHASYYLDTDEQAEEADFQPGGPADIPQIPDSAEKKVLSWIGMATKANKIVSGEFATERAVKTGKATLVFVSGDASANTKKKFRNSCMFYEVPLYSITDKESLGKAMGKEMRSSVAIVDPGFAEAILKVLDSGKKLPE